MVFFLQFHMHKSHIPQHVSLQSGLETKAIPPKKKEEEEGEEIST